jgi:hypothetical protein
LFLNQEQNKGMKTFAQILSKVERGDYSRVAAMVGCTRKNVELIVKGERPDNYNVQKIFSELIAQRNELKRTSIKLNRNTGAFKTDEGAMMGMAY